MKIAVTYDNGEVFQHFGHSEQFKIYETDSNSILSSKVVDTNGSGHGALAGFLKDHGIEVLICGGIGGGARTALAEAGITLYPGTKGSADEQVKALLAGNLNYQPDTVCEHHDHAHGAGHTCGEHGCKDHGTAK
ncbi:NifB/NifX family molybdenum-iron cluster-binding protein [Diplocloster agilis]|uniref:NifB/NifX family molybdenum-iron cluster-binding protein n=1 Tax=Diplocloster agilis TaxID=2850323 RepID=UPI000821C812|nr:NifB/NifX family molybdenum-iron cluster-binding protein [Suonthocola fibrivorans]MCU6735747.1 NifB/NifX family molybdenum-iron cluster-binding protein [Suonthocola fibrivorans]SCJ81141.1 nitrogenase cofactor biosynthesis protein NifB [uncultured Clostridium sp.]